MSILVSCIFHRPHKETDTKRIRLFFFWHFPHFKLRNWIILGFYLSSQRNSNDIFRSFNWSELLIQKQLVLSSSLLRTLLRSLLSFVIVVKKTNSMYFPSKPSQDLRSMFLNSEKKKKKNAWQMTNDKWCRHIVKICALDLRLKLIDKTIVVSPLTGRLTRMLLTNNESFIYSIHCQIAKKMCLTKLQRWRTKTKGGKIHARNSFIEDCNRFHLWKKTFQAKEMLSWTKYKQKIPSHLLRWL